MKRPMVQIEFTASPVGRKGTPRGRICHPLHLLLAVALLLISPSLQAQAPRGGILVGNKGEEVEFYKQSFALVIGASQYTRGWTSLRGVKQDVGAIQEALKEHGFVVELLEDPNAETLPRQLEDFIHRRGQDPSNRLVIYYAGHGHVLPMDYGGDMGYLVPIDAPTPSADETTFRRMALDMEQLVAMARRIQSRHALFVLDACFSGTLFSVDRSTPPDIGFRLARPVRQFITSGAESETVPDQSIFRRQFIAGLRGEADVSRDGYVTGTELGEFVAESVSRYTSGRQHPMHGKIRDPNLDRGDLVFELKGKQHPPQAREHGYAWLNARPQAVVRVDGRIQDSFPVQNVRLPAGRHTLSFEWGSGQRLERSVALSAGGTIRCAASLAVGRVDCLEDRGGSPETPGSSRGVAERVLATEVPDGRGMVLTFPGVSPTLVTRAIAAAGPPILLASAAQVVPADEAVTLIDDLRRRQLVQNLQPGDAAKENVCDPTLPGFGALLEQSATALEFLELDRAGALLSQGLSAFGCEGELVRQQELGTYLFLSGLLQYYLSQNDGGLFAEALAIDPGLPNPTEHPKAIQELFAQSKRTLNSRPTATIRLRESDLAGLELWVDGSRFSGVQALPVGKHFLQMRSTEGVVLGGHVAVIEANAGGDELVWPPPRLRAPDREVLLAELRRTALGSPPPRLATALQELMRVAAIPWLLLLAPTDGGSVEGRILEPRGPGASYRVRVQKASAPGVAATVVSSVITLAFTGMYAWHRAQMYPEGVTHEDALQLRQNAAIGLGGMAVGLAGTAAAVSLTWQIPPRWYRNTQARRASR